MPAARPTTDVDRDRAAIATVLARSTRLERVRRSTARARITSPVSASSQTAVIALDAGQSPITTEPEAGLKEG